MTDRLHHVCMIHPIDLRGNKVGGIETYIRDYIEYYPQDMDILVVGIDGFGDLEIGKVTTMTFRDRSIDFLPIMRHDENRTNEAASALRDSLTLRFAMSLIRHWRTLKRITSARHSTLELRRVEFAPVAASLRRPFIQMLHDGAEKQSSQMSSLLKKYWLLKEFGDYLALALCDRFYCVSEVLTARLQGKYPRFARKIDTVTTWANTSLFRPSAFDLSGDELRIVYAGRLDLFKSPSTMFRVVERVRELNGSKVEFHYIGDGDTSVFPEFKAIEDITVRHGKQTAAGVAEIIARSHIGILTSEFEGMPRSVMETLASGRPVCALHLPQLEQVITDRRTGGLVSRSPQQIDELANRIVETWKLIRSGGIRPCDVGAAVAPFSPERLLSKVYAEHRKLRDRAVPVRQRREAL